MEALIVFNEPGHDEADADVLVQVAWARQALETIGYRVSELAVTLDLRTLNGRLQTRPPRVAMYLVESLGGTDRLLHLPAELLAAYGVPYTGAPADVLKSLVSKSRVKQHLLACELPTPAWLSPEGVWRGEGIAYDGGVLCEDFIPGAYIIKADSEHASRGLDQNSVQVAETLDELRQLCRARSLQVGLPCLAERIVNGREFNASLLDRGDGTPEVLPLAEIDFSALPIGHTRIVDWQAKWDAASVAYQATPRVFPGLQQQPDLASELRRLATACWHELGLGGYARVDMRVDEYDEPWILEINANPCLSPDAGFYAACCQHGLAPQQIIERLLAAAMR
jgi:D-alanine-D-alanine ligase